MPRSAQEKRASSSVVTSRGRRSARTPAPGALACWAGTIALLVACGPADGPGGGNPCGLKTGRYHAVAVFQINPSVCSATVADPSPGSFDGTISVDSSGGAEFPMPGAASCTTTLGASCGVVEVVCTGEGVTGTAHVVLSDGGTSFTGTGHATGDGGLMNGCQFFDWTLSGDFVG